MSGRLANDLNKVLIVGGGIAGMAAAIRLREAGVEQIEMIDVDPQWRVYGTGITLSTLTMRALCDLGFRDEILAHGFAHNRVSMRTSAGKILNVVESPSVFADGTPSEGGILRPVLHKMMSERVLGYDIKVRLGLTVEKAEQDEDGVSVTFTDGSTGRYDFVIGADGLFSKMRELVFPDTPKPTFTGQACWRVLFDRPDDFDHCHMYMGKMVKAGFNPCAPDKMYMFVLEHVPGNPRRSQDELVSILQELTADFEGEAGELIRSVKSGSQIVYRPLESILIDGDWYCGRILLIGDAVHATTPHLGSGAGMAVEDAIVLVDELKKTSVLEVALQNFMDRRLPRGKAVVGNSLRIGDLEMAGAPMSEIGPLFGQSLQMIAQPY
ncbi:FAD-dependent monooxygenase [Rhizobium sp. L1K21]|uniref:FAD-dependent monooxygenase n=1 Tax=Rhizobium sp. L1K21 TaxID=2954933 RepID=UPI0020925B52|nr:FAD-dependent monooxygenase [Rhizobium sp. L1K21]MCO6187578.1 FAD-dependent monooxygenase [Rhizobium sp. L1K21]